MVVKVYISGISGNKEVKKRQQRVLMILDSKNIKYDVIDITEPGREADKDFMQGNATSSGATVSDPSPRSPLPPQVFNDDDYCGDYDQFDMANEVDTLEQFLKVEVPPEEPAENGTAEIAANGDVAASKMASKENSQERNGSKAASKEGSPAAVEKEGTPTREGSLAKQGASKEGTPGKELTPEKDAEDPKAENSKEPTPEKETTPDRKSVEKEIEKSVTTEVEGAEESTDLHANKNGSASSREHSVETTAVIDSKKDDPSAELIKTEQTAASD